MATESFPVSTFPSSLKIIKEGAFENTNLNTIVFNLGIIHIEDYAFQKTNGLHDVYIPESTEYIGNNVFPNHITIHGIRTSFAEQWAKENGYSFIIDNVWGTNTSTPIVHIVRICFLVCCFVIPYDKEKLIMIRKRISEVILSMRPQDRSELYPINYRFP